MTEAPDRRPAVALALALLFLAAMVGLYLASTATPELPAVAPAAAPAPRALTPTTAAPSSSLTSRPATGKPPRPPRPALPQPVDEEPADEAPEDPLAPAELEISVVDDGGNGLSRVLVRASSDEGGPQKRLVTDTSGKVTARLEPAEYSLVAERADGMLVARSEPVVVDASEGGSWSIELVLSSEPMAGLGVGIQPDANGVRVTLVHEGTPAEEEGLVAGDVIVAVEGEETAGMPLPEFIAKMTGPVGTKVLFDIVREDGSEERLQIRRALIEDKRARPASGPDDR
jgi:C-terminal processing protease CtpA/Prc